MTFRTITSYLGKIKDWISENVVIKNLSFWLITRRNALYVDKKNVIDVKVAVSYWGGYITHSIFSS